MRKQHRKQYFADILRHLILAWLLAALAAYTVLPDARKDLNGTGGLEQMSFFMLMGGTVLLFAGLWLLAGFVKKDFYRLERVGIFVVFAVMAVLSLEASFSWPFFVGVVAVVGILGVYAARGWNGDAMPPFSDGRVVGGRVIIAVLALLFFFFVSLWTVSRILTFSAPTYDCGIFSQMFYQMKTTGLPDTTVERDGLLSHFKVHMSPIYYLLLPFYWLFPSPITLQVLQAAVLASAVVPAWKLVKLHGILGCESDKYNASGYGRGQRNASGHVSGSHNASGHVSGSRSGSDRGSSLARGSCRSRNRWPPLFAAGILFCLILLLYPAYSGGTSYDIHENAFLTPLLLWLFYGIDRRKSWMTTLCFVLTLMVKEDAAVYVAVIALWLLLSAGLSGERGWRCKAGALMLVGALIYFFGVTTYLSRYGDGVMTYRYANFIYDGSSSLLTVIKAVFLMPMKVIYECMTWDKLGFMALTLLPLGLLPLLTRRYERFVLLIPWILVNLMSDYQYQHDIFFQYTYGSTACLFYLAVLNYSDHVAAVHVRNGRSLPIHGRHGAGWALGLKIYLPLICAAIAAAVCFAAVVVPKAARYPVRYIEHRADYNEINTKLKKIPEDASVTATTFYTVPLSERNVLYDVRYASREHLLSTEYVVLGAGHSDSYKPYASEGGADGYERLVALLRKNGYLLVDEIPGILAVYHKQARQRCLAVYHKQACQRSLTACDKQACQRRLAVCDK